MEMSITNTTLSLDTNDRYANGSARFIIEGMEALNTDDSAPTLADHKQQENDNYTMGIDSEGTNKTQETSRTADGVGRSNGTHSSQTEQAEGDSRDSNKETWQRVGSSTAESQLHQRMTCNREAPDPGGEPQGRQP